MDRTSLFRMSTDPDPLTLHFYIENQRITGNKVNKLAGNRATLKTMSLQFLLIYLSSAMLKCGCVAGA